MGLATALTDSRFGIPPHLSLLNKALIDVAYGRCKRLMVTMPPRHGKSEACSHYFPAWFIGRFPDRRVILASYEARYAESWGRKVRDSIGTACERGYLTHGPRRDQSSASDWAIAGHAGGMVTAGVGGPITGRGADLLVIDDPVKNAEEANSPTYREKAWDWYSSTAYTRLEPGGAVIIIQTRWHKEDLAGRLVSPDYSPPDEIARWRIIDFPAIAQEHDALGRAPGEALWPARYPAAELDRIRHQIGQYWWSALYQQSPTTRGGNFFKEPWLQYVDAIPCGVTGSVRYWDLASTEGSGDWTAGVRIDAGDDGNYYISDVVHERRSPAGVRALVYATAQRDGLDVPVYVEEDPGQAGKDQIASYQRDFPDMRLRGNRVTGPKATRADIVASKMESGVVRLVRGAWNRAYVDELLEFNADIADQQDDQVDATSGAFSKAVRGHRGIMVF